ncbi:hypothetical protein ACH79_33810 [Bradyrhizobium sp. CCBAU 051011]|uniref:hypothetical protein n=1 Tax=Bradyrhizobium sp. CCBAU 051011 TaxID=858422 RepID=UPI001373F0FA|nr:hypothetical protein [Bradyrhizobium sp. CCBAU 051011]QHO76877.1 hypothetical protein ACH79_33810 [Bradyrhizobium sp. CCBAU 051011]
MNRAGSVVALSVFLMINLSSDGVGQNNPALRLQCDWLSTLDVATMRTSPTSGSKLISVEVLQGRAGRLKKEGLGAEFAAVVTDEQIEAETEYQMGALRHRERITINRYTGKIDNFIVIGKAELVHHGLCKQLPGRMF